MRPSDPVGNPEGHDRGQHARSEFHEPAEARGTPQELIGKGLAGHEKGDDDAEDHRDDDRHDQRPHAPAVGGNQQQGEQQVQLHLERHGPQAAVHRAPVIGEEHVREREVAQPITQARHRLPGRVATEEAHDHHEELRQEHGIRKGHVVGDHDATHPSPKVRARLELVHPFRAPRERQEEHEAGEDDEEVGSDVLADDRGEHGDLGSPCELPRVEREHGEERDRTQAVDGMNPLTLLRTRYRHRVKGRAVRAESPSVRRRPHRAKA